MDNLFKHSVPTTSVDFSTPKLTEVSSLEQIGFDADQNPGFYSHCSTFMSRNCGIDVRFRNVYFFNSLFYTVF